MLKEIIKKVNEKKNRNNEKELKIDIEKAKKIFKERKELFDRLKDA